jgi:hypothetical protein
MALFHHGFHCPLFALPGILMYASSLTNVLTPEERVRKNVIVSEEKKNETGPDNPRRVRPRRSEDNTQMPKPHFIEFLSKNPNVMSSSSMDNHLAGPIKIRVKTSAG